MLELVRAHKAIEDDPLTAAIWIRREDREAWLVEVLPALAHDDAPGQPVTFNASRSFRHRLNLIASNEDGLERAIRHDQTLESEIAAGVRLERLDPAVDFAKYERGRVFCAERELRWERVDGVFRAVLVGDAQPFALFAPAPELDLSGAQTGTRRYFLWGLRIEDSDLAVVGVQRAGRGEPYLEMRIPRVLRYPAAGSKRRTRLVVCEYIDPQTGGVIYSRLAGVEEV